MQDRKIGFIGAGKMAESLISCFIEKKLVDANHIVVSCPGHDRQNYLNKKYGISVTGENQTVVDSVDMVILAVKPHQLQTALKNLVGLENKLIVSILAGIKTKKIEQITNSKIIRLMPNLCCQVNHSAGGYSINEKITEEDEKLFLHYFSEIGFFYKVEEEKLNIITAISGSGPAFFAFFIDEFVKAGVKNGLPRDIALSLALNTCFGTAKYLAETKTEPGMLIEKISTHGGTTEAGFDVIKKSDIGEDIFGFIMASKKRAEEIGNYE